MKSKHRLILSSPVALLLMLTASTFSPGVRAQENYTEGPVWVINYYRTKPGKFDEYLKFLRGEYVKSIAKQKAAGLIVDSKVMLNTAVNGPDDWDVAVAYLLSDYSKLNYNKADEDKLEEIGKEITGEMDKGKRTEKGTAARVPLRDYIRTSIVREVAIRP